jgi:ribosomal protein S18 acetylase RimI-like enzyme
MPVTLTPIESNELAEFLALIRPQYVSERMQADRLSRVEAEQFVTTQWERTLPQGAATAGHHLFWARDDSLAAPIGLLWISLEPRHAQAFIYEIIVFEAFRGRGFGRDLLSCAEEFARTHRARAISLNVFSPNRTAIALYASAGFEAVSQHMSKEL